MATELLYLKDFGVVSGDATVVSVAATEDGRTAVVLDQTCFYPRGGGQDWDTGIITADTATFTVEEVRLDETGSVQHIGSFDDGKFAPGDTVRCEVNAERRALNTRLHSAGHLLDLAVNRLGYLWVPSKGAHYPHVSFVEYTGEFDPEQAEQMRSDIERTIQEAANEPGENEIRFMPVSEMHTVCRHVPPNIPANKPARVVIYCGDFGVPCGGTHVRRLGDIGVVKVTKLNCKKGVIKATYAVEGIN